MSNTNVMQYFETFKNSSTDQGELFKSLIMFNNCKTIVEIGVAYGTTTYYLCKGAEKHGGMVYGYDLWNKHGTSNQYSQLSSLSETQKYLNESGISNFVLTKVDTKSDEFRNNINENLKEIDFAFIDGDHSYEGVYNDFKVIYPNLSKTGIIAFHDTLRIDGCREFIVDLRTKFYDGTYDIIDLPFGNDSGRAGISILIKRNFHLVGIPINEICGSNSTMEEIYEKERQYIKNEIKSSRMKKEVTKVEKPWGWEKWIEVNENYVVKELFMTAGNSCSLQYHEKKHESFYVIKGQLKFYVGPDKDNLIEMILNEGDYHTIEPFVVHRMEAVVDSLYLESSTNFLDDVIRIEDKYGRI